MNTEEKLYFDSLFCTISASDNSFYVFVVPSKVNHAAYMKESHTFRRQIKTEVVRKSGKASD